MKRPCTCDRVRRGSPFTGGQCRLCWLYHHDPAYRALWDQPGSITSLPAGARPPCRHRGAALREEQCPVCRGHVQVKVFACALHRECTVARAVPSRACCGTCADHESAAPPSTSAPAAAALPARLA